MGQLSNQSLGNYIVEYEGTPTPEIQLKGGIPATEIVDGSTSPVTTNDTDFGDVIVGSSINKTFTIENSGVDSLALTDSPSVVALTGTCTGFSVTAQPTSSCVAPNGLTTFTIQYQPIVAGTHSCTVSIDNNDSNENPYDFSIQGVGVTPPEIDIQGNSISIADGDTTPGLSDNTDFGSTPIDTPISKIFTIANTGEADLNLSDKPLIALTGDGCAAFNVTTEPTTPVTATSGTTNFIIEYKPIAAGTHTCTVSIANDDPDENLYNFSIQGSTPAKIDIQGNGTNIADGDTTPNTADHTDFGNTSIGSSVSHTFMIANTGEAILNLSGTPLVALTGAGCAAFSVTTPPTTPVAATSGTTFFTIQYNPLTVGTHTCTVSIANDDSNKNPYNFNIQGIGLMPETNVTLPEMNIQGNGVSIAAGDTKPTTADNTHFGSTLLGTPISKTFTITNTGRAILNLSGTPLVALTGADCTAFSVTIPPTTPIAVTSGTTTFTIQYNPLTVGTHTCTVSIANDDSNENPYDFNILGKTALVANDDSASTTQNIPVTVAVLSNDRVPEGDLNLLSLKVTTPPLNATVTVNPDSTITYLPKPGVTANTDSFIYQLCDGDNPPQCATATVTITIARQLPPVAANLNAPITFNNAIVQLPPLAAQDSDGTVTIYTIAALPLSIQGILYLGDPAKDGQLVAAGQEIKPDQIGKLFFQPANHFIGTASFTYTATDNLGAISNFASVTIPVEAPVNHPPLAHNDTGNTHSEMPVTIPANLPPVADNKTASTLNDTSVLLPPLSATDTDGSIVSYTITTLPLTTQGILYLGDPQTTGQFIGLEQELTPNEAENLFFQPHPDTVGEVTFNYLATDDQGEPSTTATVTISVTAPPVIIPEVPTITYQPPSTAIDDARFFGKIWSTSGKVGKRLSIDAPEPIQITGAIQPSSKHIGELADIRVIYDWRSNPDDQSLTVPVTIASQQRLTTQMEFSLFEGYLIGLAGQFEIRLGYQLNNGTFLSAPILSLKVEPDRPPADIDLSHQTVLEYSLTDTLIGSFTTTDPDNQEQFRYGLVDNPGDYFKVVGGELRVNYSLPSQKVQSAYPITVRSVDLSGSAIEKSFLIQVLNAKTQPQEIYLTQNTVVENSPGGTMIGRLWTLDSQSSHYSYELLDDAQGQFTLEGDLLRVAPEATLDFETQPTYAITVRSWKTEEPQFHLEKTFTIDLINQIDVTVLTEFPDSQRAQRLSAADGQNQDEIELTLQLLPDPTHQGKSAELMRVMFWRPLASSEIFMYRPEGTQWIPWHGDLAELLTGQVLTLQRQHEMKLVLKPPFDWNQGEINLVVGYQLSAGEIFYAAVPWHS
ncbi:hypothetical protein THII_3159 [Thioploca ingrica]|uniref:Cadherin domain-containing protein n=1 Tax=Thioploca ingrica TaxID=40754 RepID=A0A090BVU3_9GAMM|nr:hypothetical protein THII_3159 [Thioploca ingrica]